MCSAVENSMAGSSDVRRLPNSVFTATQVDLGGWGPLYERLAAKAARATAMATFRYRAAIATHATAIRRMPDHPSPGKRTPAAVTGDAHPIIPSGGMVTAISATGSRHTI